MKNKKTIVLMAIVLVLICITGIETANLCDGVSDALHRNYTYIYRGVAAVNEVDDVSSLSEKESLELVNKIFQESFSYVIINNCIAESSMFYKGMIMPDLETFLIEMIVADASEAQEILCVLMEIEEAMAPVFDGQQQVSYNFFRDPKGIKESVREVERICEDYR